MECMEVRCDPASPAPQAEALGVVGQGSAAATADRRIWLAVCMSTGRLRWPPAGTVMRTDSAPSAARALEVRDAAHHVHAQSRARFELLSRPKHAAATVPRKGHQLQVEVGADLLLHVQQGLHGQQARVADIRRSGSPAGLATAQSQ